MADAADRRFAMYIFGVGTVGFSALAYYIWKNSPAERAKGNRENLGPGEWYLAAYTGFSYLPAADWKFFRTPHNPELQGRTLKNITYQPGVLGGIKFGRYFDSFPWFGVELETNFSKHDLRGQRVSISPPLPKGQANLPFPPDRFYIWDMQINLLGRYGFLKDKEVTFGRLQPYIGVGPGFEVVYGTTDSAKNFAIEAQAGLRYMFTPKLAIFCEYKFSYQFKIEYEMFVIDKFKPSTMSFNVPHHRVVLGISYHFKNLFGK
jgi:opacity protein-like surface antigen